MTDFLDSAEIDHGQVLNFCSLVGNFAKVQFGYHKTDSDVLLVGRQLQFWHICKIARTTVYPTKKTLAVLPIEDPGLLRRSVLTSCNKEAAQIDATYEILRPTFFMLHSRRKEICLKLRQTDLSLRICE